MSTASSSAAPKARLPCSRPSSPDSGAEIVAVAESEPLGRGGGLRFAAERREESGPLFAFNGDELHDVDLRAVLDAHEEHGGAATIVVAPLKSQFGVVELEADDRVTGFVEAPRLPHWVNAGVYVLDDEALERLPERGDHEQTTFPELARDGKLFAFRHEGLWITVNTPKDLQRAEEHYAAHPELRPTLARRTRSVPSAQRTGGGGLGEPGGSPSCSAERPVRAADRWRGSGKPGGSPS